MTSEPVVSVSQLARASRAAYADLVEGGRDEAVEALRLRLRWFGEDCIRTGERLAEAPDIAVSLILSLSTMMQDLDRMAGIYQALAQSKRDVSAWDAAREEGMASQELVAE